MIKNNLKFGSIVISALSLSACVMPIYPIKTTNTVEEICAEAQRNPIATLDIFQNRILSLSGKVVYSERNSTSTSYLDFYRIYLRTGNINVVLLANRFLPSKDFDIGRNVVISGVISNLGLVKIEDKDKRTIFKEQKVGECSIILKNVQFI